MKNSILFIVLGFLFMGQSLSAQDDFRKSAPKPGPAPRIELGEAAQFTLGNGLKVIVVENHKLPRVSFQIFVDVPPLLEGELAGYTSLAGDLLSKGTTTHSKAEIDEAIDFIGASLNTYSKGMTGSSLTKHKDKLLTMMSEVLLSPTFPVDEFEKIKKQTMANLAQQKDDPNAIASNVSAVLRNGKNHPYGEIQTEESTEKITVDACKSFYENYFKPNISYLIVTGDISLKEAKALAPKYFGSWKQGNVKKEHFDTPNKPAATELDFVDKAGAVQSVINITYPVDLKPGSSDIMASSVMNTVLGAYFSSRLNANLREDKGYTYGANSSLSSDPYAGSFTASASVRNEVTDSSLTQFLLELNKLKEKPVSDEELQMVKNVMTGNFARSLENPGTIGRFTLNTARYNLPADYYATYLERLNAVTKEDVAAAAKKYLIPGQAHILVVGNRDEVAAKLKPFANGGKINYFDHYGKPVEEVRMAIPEGVTAQTVLSDYLAAIGGLGKLNAITSVTIKMEAAIQGMTLELEMNNKAPNKLKMTNKMMGNVMQESIFNGTNGTQSQMGQSSPMDETTLQDMNVDGYLFPERKYSELGVKTELKGIEIVEGRKAYKIIVSYPSGTKKTHFFDMESSLKIREIEIQGGVTVTNDIGDYKEVEGIKFPHTTTINGAAPFSIKMEMKSVTVNAEMSDDLFKIE